jgi:hypothetical protein
MDIYKNISDTEYRAALAREYAPKDVLTTTTIISVKAITGIFTILIPLQVITTSIGGCLIGITFGFFTLLLSVVWLPFYGLLVGTSWLWINAWYLRLILIIPGICIATIGYIYVMLAPEPEKDAKVMKLAITDMWPLSWYLIKPPAIYYKPKAINSS